MKQIDCPRCYGKGHIKGYSHVQGGICFKCGGAGKVNAPRTRKPTKRQQLKEAERLAHAELQAQRQQRAVEVYKDDPRLRVDSDHPYFTIHCQELAMCDGKWETLA